MPEKSSRVGEADPAMRETIWVSLIRRSVDRRTSPVVLGDAAQGWVEARVERLLQGLRREPWRFLPVVGQVHQPGDQRPRVRPAQRLLAVQVVEQVPDGL